MKSQRSQESTDRLQVYLDLQNNDRLIVGQARVMNKYSNGIYGCPEICGICEISD